MAKKAKKKTRKSRGLVIGYLERISSDVFERHSKVITALVGGKQGIYALYRNNRLYYVGLATNLKNRVKHHLKDRHAGKWDYFSLFLVRSERFLKDLESLSLRIAWPKGNRAMGKFGTAPNLRPALKKKIAEAVWIEISRMLGGTGPKAGPGADSAKRKAAAKKAATTLKAKKAGKDRPLKGVFPGGKVIYGKYKGKEAKAWVRSNGGIRLAGKTYDSPSTAAAAVRGQSTNGWTFWRYKNEKGQWVRLKELRKKK